MIPVPLEATFRSGPPVPRSSLETFSGTVPARAAALWGEHGLGQTAGGYLRIVDPAQWVDVLAEADECLGGRRSAETLQRVAMREHLLLIASLAGALD